MDRPRVRPLPDWWNEGSSSTAEFPRAFSDQGQVTVLGTPDVADSVRDELRSRSRLSALLAYFIKKPFSPNTCLLAAKYLASIYFDACVTDSFVESCAQACPGSTLTEKMVRAYSQDLERSAQLWRQGLMDQSAAKMAIALRAACHSFYGFRAALNTHAVIAKQLPAAASAYVDVKKGKIGPAMLQMFFLGPDGEADPEVILFAPAGASFVQPLDQRLARELSQAVERAAPDDAHLCLASTLNKSFRKRGAKPRIVRAPKRNGTRRSESDQEEDLLDDD